MINRQSGIYKILNKINGKFYIGSAVDFYERWHSHKHYLETNRHHNAYLQRAWVKYQSVSFEFMILEYCEKEKLIEREQFWIDQTKCYDRKVGYNIRLIANSNVGLKFSDEHKAKMSAWQVGRTLSEETKEKISNALVGIKLSKETKLKMRKLDKWPCKDGSKCRCETCKDTRRKLHTEWRFSERRGSFRFRG